MNIKSSVYTFLVLALGFTACIKKEVTPLKDEGATFVKILGGSSPAVVKSNPIDFVTTPQTIVVCDVRKDAANSVDLAKTTTVTIKDDTAAVRAANPNYLHLPTAWYSLVGAGITKTGGMGGNYTVNFNSGDFAKEIASLAVIMGIVERKGGWFYLGERKWQGIDSVISSIREEVDLKEELQKAVLSSDAAPLATDEE